jgi:indolepyruvate ferredoxin oxidoreductase beta subunit
MKYDILISGVGGQGQVLASRLIGAAAIEAGLSARTGETIGMAQRGGCVLSNVRIGDGIASPSVPLGHADLIIGFELCETARVLNRLSPCGRVILNDHIISPVTVSLGLQSYDKQAMLRTVKNSAKEMLIIDASALALAAGSEKAANVVLLGAASGMGFLPFSQELLLKTIENTVPPKFRCLNLAAFSSGYTYAKVHAL